MTGSRDFFSQPIYPAFGDRTLLEGQTSIPVLATSQVFSIAGKGYINHVTLVAQVPVLPVFPTMTINIYIDNIRLYNFYLTKSFLGFLLTNSNMIIKITGYYNFLNVVYFEALFNQHFSINSYITFKNETVADMTVDVNASIQLIV